MAIDKSTNSIEELGVNRPTQAQIKIRIPKTFHEEPVISRLISEYGVTVNIAAALLGSNARDDGWFNLELQGTQPQIQSALTYLNELDVEIWSRSDTEQDGW
ncbi:MAG: NIL domain-containing protein [Cyanosarcina radialis HA8281-LM2]|nr:NIL domain-containing protein [Cyanosarcina radialis HA8281-LM2]